MIKPNLSDETVDALANSKPEAALAKGVLAQAKQDLRRFRTAQDGIGREIYFDAYTWVASDDVWWPYSFLNVCEVLSLAPETLRTKLLAYPQLGWYSHSIRIAQSLSSSLRGSIAKVCGTRARTTNSHRSNRPVLAN
jgi:hypothetical protein